MVEEVLMNKVSWQYSNTDIITGDIVGNNSNILFYFQYISILNFFLLPRMWTSSPSQPHACAFISGLNDINSVSSPLSLSDFINLISIFLELSAYVCVYSEYMLTCSCVGVHEFEGMCFCEMVC